MLYHVCYDDGVVLFRNVFFTFSPIIAFELIVVMVTTNIAIEFSFSPCFKFNGHSILMMLGNCFQRKINKDFFQSWSFAAEYENRQILSNSFARRFFVGPGPVRWASLFLHFQAGFRWRGEGWGWRSRAPKAEGHPKSESTKKSKEEYKQSDCFKASNHYVIRPSAASFEKQVHIFS